MVTLGFCIRHFGVWEAPLQPGLESCMGKPCTGFTPMDTFAMRHWFIYQGFWQTISTTLQPMRGCCTIKGRQFCWKCLHLPTSYFWVNGYASCCVCKASNTLNWTFHTTKKRSNTENRPTINVLLVLIAVNSKIQQTKAISYNWSHLIATSMRVRQSITCVSLFWTICHNRRIRTGAYYYSSIHVLLTSWMNLDLTHIDDSR